MQKIKVYDGMITGGSEMKKKRGKNADSRIVGTYEVEKNAK